VGVIFLLRVIRRKVMSIKECSRCLVNSTCDKPCDKFIPPKGRGAIYYLIGCRLGRLRSYHRIKMVDGKYKISKTEILTINLVGWISIKCSKKKFTIWNKLVNK
jgi:hypothetical protein